MEVFSMERIPIYLPDTGNPRFKTKELRICEECGCIYQPRTPRAKYCSETCRYEVSRRKAKESIERRKQEGTYSKGGDFFYRKIDGVIHKFPRGMGQCGKFNNNFVNGTGIDWYEMAIISGIPEVCNRCGKELSYVDSKNGNTVRDLLLHHKDGNHSNNDPSNWEILCKKCHQNHHSKRDSVNGRFVSRKG